MELIHHRAHRGHARHRREPGGRKAGATSQEENATATKLECAEEIARLLRLRDMGGIIAVDFIDMGQVENRRKLTEAPPARP